MKSACFTGHRRVDSGDILPLKTLLDSVICSLADRGVTDFYCGGALGFDTICASMIIYLRKRKALDIKLHLVLPCRNEEQTSGWSDKDKHEFYSIMMFADEIEYTGSDYTKKNIKKRNQQLVNMGDICIAYYDGVTKRSGTAQTVRMANEKGIEIINLYNLMQ